MFEPRANQHRMVKDFVTDGQPSGFADLPRPFVLRAASLDGRRFGAGERFTLDVNVFDPATPALDYFRLAFERLCVEGLGVGRPRVELVEAGELAGVEIDLLAQNGPVDKIRVAFLTPAELKIGGEILREPRFDALFKRARDRVAGLIELYQPQARAPERDFKAMGDRASAVRMTGWQIRENRFERRSARTGQRHSLGGFTGAAEFEGELAEFLPFLQAAWWTGVGRLTVWGNGMIRVEAPGPSF